VFHVRQAGRRALDAHVRPVRFADVRRVCRERQRHLRSVRRRGVGEGSARTPGRSPGVPSRHLQLTPRTQPRGVAYALSVTQQVSLKVNSVARGLGPRAADGRKHIFTPVWDPKGPMALWREREAAPSSFPLAAPSPPTAPARCAR
jgi:hypothetical protein